MSGGKHYTEQALTMEMLDSKIDKLRWDWESSTSKITTLYFHFNGGGSVITTGYWGDLPIHINFAIMGWTLTGSDAAGTATGAIKIDIWKDTYANYPPTNADSICNGHEPEIVASGTKAQDMDLGDWLTRIVRAGRHLAFYVDSCATFTLATLALKIRRL
jgi:hypothetical protein